MAVWRSPAHYEIPLIQIEAFDLTHGHLVKQGNSFYYTDHIIRYENLRKIALCCEVIGCEYYTGDYKEFFRHLRKVHGYKLMKLPRLLANTIEKSLPNR